MTTTELRVFISSTFRDLQAEREHLVKKIFPEIRALCRARGVTFTDIDLRWGITEEEAEREGIIHICLDEIDRCRPYFIGILGERYGWTPPRADADRIADRFPVLGSRLLDGASITEMEIVHGVLANPGMAGHAFFYFRDRDATPAEFIDTDPDIAGQLRDLKNRIRASGFPVRENFTSPAELGEWLEEDLRRVVDIEHPESETPSPLELERRAHRAFAASRTRAYVVNPEYDKRFDEWLMGQGRGVRDEGRGARAEGLGMGDEESKPIQHPSSLSPQPSPLSPNPSPLIPQPSPLVITAASGLGKSSLVAHLVAGYRQEHPTACVIEHYVGASDAGGSATAIIRHVVEEILERFDITEALPAKAEELEKSFPNWLFRAARLSEQEGISMLIVLDALNQLDESGQRLGWLPKIIPPGIGLIVSTIPGESARRLVERGWDELVVAPLEDDDVRQRIVVRYLGEFRKAITPEQVRRVTGNAKARSPLYLRVVAEEMRLHGEHETLDAKIDAYSAATDLEEVFDRVLERLEHDYGEAPVRDLLCAIWASRTGLAEEELLEITGLSRLDLSRLLFALDYHLVQRGGFLGFFHDYLRRAVQTRYLGDGQRRTDLRTTLSAFFETSPLSVRTALELLWQYGADGEATPEWDRRLAHTLSRVDVLAMLWNGDSEAELLRRWTQLATRGWDVVESYRRSLALDTEPAAPRRGVALKAAARLLDALGKLDASAETYGDLVRLGETLKQKNLEAAGRLGRGHIKRMRGEFDAAMEHYEAVLRLTTESDDRMGMAAVSGGMGNVHWQQGRFAEAMECYARSLALSEEIGDRDGAAKALLNMGNVHSNQGRFEKALECFREAIASAEERGDLSSVSVAIGNVGNIYSTQSRDAEALECYRRQIAICEDLGDTNGIARAIGNMGTVFSHLGRIDEAIEWFERQIAICEQLGDRRLRAIAMGNIGGAHLTEHRYEKALMFFTQAAEEHRRIGYRFGLSYWLEGIASTLLALAALDEMPSYLPAHLPGVSVDDWRSRAHARARECATECVTISDALAKPDTQRRGRILLARVDAAEGDVPAGLARLEELLAGETNDPQRAELHYWMWRIGARREESGVSKEQMERAIEHRREALRLFTALEATAPKHDYKKRIEECKIEECKIEDGRFQI